MSREISGGSDLAPEVEPTLAEAHRRLRARTRSAEYFARGDAFARQFLGDWLSVEARHVEVMAVDIAAALDTCYEDIAARGPPGLDTLLSLSPTFDSALSPEMRCDRLIEEDSTDPGGSLITLAASLLRWATMAGLSSVTRGTDAETGSRWRALWTRSILRHNDCQERQSVLTLLRDTSPLQRPQILQKLTNGPLRFTPRATSFEEGAIEYLDAFSESSAASTAFLGSMAFSRELLSRGMEPLLHACEAMPDWLPLVDRLLRLGLDVRFTSNEVLNTGVYATAAERRTSVLDIDPTSMDPATVETRLRAVWPRVADKARQDGRQLLARFHVQGNARELLVALLERSVAISERLAA